jgi:hypothetical protein
MDRTRATTPPEGETMKRERLTVSPFELRTTLLSRLRGRVFHVTCGRTLEGIIESGAVIPNADGQFASAFLPADGSYYRRRGCVCVFDYRAVEESELTHSLDSCAPYDAFHQCEDRIAILFLSERAIQRLDKSAAWDSKEMFAWYVEAGHPGPLLLSDVDEVLEVSIAYPSDPFLLALREKNKHNKFGGKT